MTYNGGQVTKPIIVVKMPCKLLYIIQVKDVFNFLALVDIRVFGRLLASQSGCFCLGYHSFL